MSQRIGEVGFPSLRRLSRFLRKTITLQERISLAFSQPLRRDERMLYIQILWCGGMLLSSDFLYKRGQNRSHIALVGRRVSEVQPSCTVVPMLSATAHHGRSMG